MANEVILERLRETASQMADQIVKAVGYKEFNEIMGVDTLNAVLLGFVFLAAVIVIATNIFQKKKNGQSNEKAIGQSKGKATGADEKHERTSGASVATSPKSLPGASRPIPVQETIVASKLSESQSSAPSKANDRIPGSPLVRGTENDSVQWIDNAIQWSYGPTGKEYFHRLEEAWLTSLNVMTKKAAAESGVHLVFEKIVSESNIPKLDNVSVTLDTSNTVTMKSDVNAIDLGFGVQVSGQKGETTWSKRLTVTMERLNGQIRVACLPEELMFVVKFDGQPEMKLQLNYMNEEDRQTANDKESQALELVITDTVSSAIAAAVVDLSMSNCKDFPRFHRTEITADPILPVGYDSLVNSTPSSRANRKLLVKIMKATNLGETVGCRQPYCIVEMDSPAQKYQTSVANGTNSPFWDEHFLFDLDDRQAELLFEIYDKAKPVGNNFLGLGIVNQEELLQAPSQRQIIPLQSRPLEHDKVSGSLTVEFLFMEGAEIPDLSPSRFQNKKIQNIETKSMSSPCGTIITTTVKKTINVGQNSEVQVSSKIELTPEKPKVVTPDVIDTEKSLPMPDIMSALPSHNECAADNQSVSDSSIMDDIPEVDEPVESLGSPYKNGVESVTDAALKELESMGRTSPNTTTNKSTLIIHSVQRNGEKDVSSISDPKSGTLGSASSSSSKDGGGGDGRSRSKNKKSLMGTLKRRLSFHKRRSKSMDTDGKKGSGPDDSSRSVSSDRSSAMSSGNSFLGIIGGSNSQNQEDSTRSSISDVSGISSSSARTFIHEASTLVIETNENGVVKHYLIPASLAKKSKWKKRGTKLHIYNDHIFVAAHLPGSTECQVCFKTVPRRIGKQGYVCRDCELTCHKHCHVKVDSHCSNSTVSTMEMEYIQDKKAKTKSS